MSAADSTALNVWSWVYFVGEMFVLIGVVLEGAEIYARRAHAWRKQWNPAAPETPQDRIHFVGDVGFALLVLGLAGESSGHHFMTRITDREQMRLVRQLDSTTLIAAQLNTEASTNRERAAKLELELEKLKAWRAITNEQKQLFMSFVKYLPKGPVPIGTNRPDSETIGFSSQIAALLIEAGYSVPTSQDYNVALAHPKDVFFTLAIHDAASIPTHAVPLRLALEKMGFKSQMTTNDAFTDNMGISIPSGELRLWIGPKR